MAAYGFDARALSMAGFGKDLPTLVPRSSAATRGAPTGGAPTEASSTSTTTTCTSSCPPPPALTANLWVARTGSDRCVRSPTPVTLADAAGHICQHWDAAYQAASSATHDIVRVVDGVYESTYWTTGAVDNGQDLNRYLIRAGDAAKSIGAVTFACGSPNSREGVTFAQPASVIEGTGVVIDGGGDWKTGRPSCFRFRDVATGWTGDGAAADNFVIENAHLASLFIAGSHGVWAINDEIGPSVDCHDPSWPVAAERCRDITTDDEAYYYSRGEGVPSPLGQTQYTAAAGCAVNPSNILFQGDFIHDINGLGDNGAETHTGPIQNGGSSSGGCQVVADGITLRANLFENLIIGDFAPAGADSNVTVENNWFGPNAAPATEGRCVPLSAASPCGESRENPRAILPDERWGSAGANWLIRFNTFAEPGLNIAGGLHYRDARILGNIFLKTNVACGAGKFTFAYNVYAAGASSCPGVNQRTTSRSIVVNSAYSATSTGLDLHLAGAPGSGPADNFVVPATGDYAAGSDYDGRRRAPPRDAGASER